MTATKTDLKVLRVSPSAHKAAKANAVLLDMTLQEYIEMLIKDHTISFDPSEEAEAT